jgi:hypothetical protein
MPPNAPPFKLQALVGRLILFGQRAVLVRVLVKFLHAILAAKRNLLAVVFDVDGLAHAADLIARDRANGVDRLAGIGLSCSHRLLGSRINRKCGRGAENDEEGNRCMHKV